MGKVQFLWQKFKVRKSHLTKVSQRFGILQVCCGRLAEGANAGKIKDSISDVYRDSIVDHRDTNTHWQADRSGSASPQHIRLRGECFYNCLQQGSKQARTFNITFFTFLRISTSKAFSFSITKLGFSRAQLEQGNFSKRQNAKLLKETGSNTRFYKQPPPYPWCLYIQILLPGPAVVDSWIATNLTFLFKTWGNFPLSLLV